jgi:hypothetical protein
MTYLPQLTEEYISFFYIIHVLAGSPDGEPPKQGTYIANKQQNNNN